MIPTPRLNTAPSENIPDQLIKHHGYLIDMQLDNKIRMIRFLVKTMISIYGGEAPLRPLKHRLSKYMRSISFSLYIVDPLSSSSVK